MTLATAAKTFQWLRENVGYLVIALGIIAAYLVYRQAPKNVSADVIIASIVAMIGLVGVVLQISSSRKQESERRIQELQIAHAQSLRELKLQSFSQRKETYEALTAPFKEQMLGKIEPPKVGELDARKIGEMKFDLLHYASPRTLLAWDEWLAISAKPATKNEVVLKKRSAAMLVMYARLLMAIREDLGIDNEGIDEINLLKMFVTDVQNYEVQLREMMKVKSVKEVE